MKKHLLFILLLLAPFIGFSQSVLELDPSQSMCISGKGTGQDAAINPYLSTNSIGTIENLGANPFSIRIQQDGEILQTSTIEPGAIMAVKLLQGHELYFDSEMKTMAKIGFKELNE